MYIYTKVHIMNLREYIFPDLPLNLNIYTEKNLNLITKIERLYRNLYQIQSKKKI